MEKVVFRDVYNWASEVFDFFHNMSFDEFSIEVNKVIAEWKSKTKIADIEEDDVIFFIDQMAEDRGCAFYVDWKWDAGTIIYQAGKLIDKDMEVSDWNTTEEEFENDDSLNRRVVANFGNHKIDADYAEARDLVDDINIFLWQDGKQWMWLEYYTGFDSYGFIRVKSDKAIIHKIEYSKYFQGIGLGEKAKKVLDLKSNNDGSCVLVTVRNRFDR